MTGGEHRREAPSRAFALALGVVALITPLAVHLFLPVIPAVKLALSLSDAAAMIAIVTCSGVLCLAAGAVPFLCAPKPAR